MFDEEISAKSMPKIGVSRRSIIPSFWGSYRALKLGAKIFVVKIMHIDGSGAPAV